MLNTFPTLLTYSFVAPFILRVVLGLILIDLGLLKFRGEKRDWVRSFEAVGLRPGGVFVTVYALLEIVGGAFLIVGFWTQPAALAFVVLSGIEMYLEYLDGTLLKRDIVFYALVFAIALSLLLTGAGAYAFDIPL